MNFPPNFAIFCPKIADVIKKIWLKIFFSTFSGTFYDILRPGKKIRWFWSQRARHLAPARQFFFIFINAISHGFLIGKSQKYILRNIHCANTLILNIYPPHTPTTLTTPVESPLWTTNYLIPQKCQTECNIALVLGCFVITD